MQFCFKNSTIKRVRMQMINILHISEIYWFEICNRGHIRGLHGMEFLDPASEKIKSSTLTVTRSVYIFTFHGPTGTEISVNRLSPTQFLPPPRHPPPKKKSCCRRGKNQEVHPIITENMSRGDFVLMKKYLKF